MFNTAAGKDEGVERIDADSVDIESRRRTGQLIAKAKNFGSLP